MSDDRSEIGFDTERLSVGPWHEVANRLGVDLVQVVTELLTPTTTVALPEAWQGEYSVSGARNWITDRDADSSMLLVAESESMQPVGLLILGEVPASGAGSDIDLRVGYLFAESSWGQGLATELVSALIDWARTQPRICTLTGGVDPRNRASVRVLEKCGFVLVDGTEAATALYRYDLQTDSVQSIRARYSSEDLLSKEELVALYDAVGWSLYTDDPDALGRAVSNSTYVVTARDDSGQLIGLCRALSDDESIVYLQDVLVMPGHQRNGIGHELVHRCLARFTHVRQRVLLTDGEPHQHRLYKRLGFHDVSLLSGADLHAFVDIRGANLNSDLT